MPDTPRTWAWPPEPALGAHLAGHAGDLVGERRQLVDHRVHRRLQLQDLAPGVHGDLLRQVAARHRRGDLGDVAHLAGQVRRQLVDVLGEVAPGAGDALAPRPARPACPRADLAGHPGDLVGERRQLIDHRVHRRLQLQDLAPGIDGDLLRQVAPRHRRGHLRDVAHLRRSGCRQLVHVLGEVAPGAGDALHLGLAAQLARRCRPRGPPG